MRYCARCLYPENHPLGIVFDDEGVCSGCRVHEEKDTLDWKPRREKLKKLLAKYRHRTGANYDCIVPVSGARDSYFIVHTVQQEFGLNPLIVNYNKHYNTRRGHRNLAYLRTIFDRDIYSMILDPALLKRITQRTLELRGSMYWHCLAGQTVLPVQVAVRYKIPLIIWGAHQGIDQVGMFSHLDEVEMSRRYRKDHDLMGLEAEDLVDAAGGLPERDLRSFYYPHDKDIESVGVRGIYLNNFIRWDSKAQHERMIGHYGYESAAQQRTFDTYNDVDCIHYSGLHDAIKFWKWGYGKVTDHACRELRLKRLDRAGALDLVRRYRDIEPKDLGEFLKWMDMSEAALMELIDRHRDPRVWERDETTGAWKLLHSVLDAPAPKNGQAMALEVKEPCDFAITPSRDPAANEEAYALLHRGYADEFPAAKPVSASTT
ncbi:MAG: N-acetyl sugar amidotransferase [Rhodospirillales bacterium]